MKKTVLLVVLAMFVFALMVSCSGGGSEGSTPNPPDAKVPGAPTNLVAVAGHNGQATYTCVAPANDGGATIQYYVVTSSPSGSTATSVSCSGTISGLTDGVANTLTAAAVNSVGTGASSVASNEVTPFAPYKVNGIAGRTATDGTSLYVITTRTSLVFLTKFDTEGRVVWEVPTGCDSCNNVVLLGSYAFMFCTKGGGAFVERFDISTGAKTETEIASNGQPIGLGIIADVPTSSLYLCWRDGDSGTTLPWIARADEELTRTSGFVNGTFGGKMAVSSSAFYIDVDGAITVFRYNKDLSTHLWTAQHLPDLGGLDQPTGMTISNDGNTLYVGGMHNLMSGNPRNILLKIDATSGNTTSVTDLGQTQTLGLTEIVVDSSGTLYGILVGVNGSLIKINPVSMGVTKLIDISSADLSYLTLDKVNGKLFVSTGTDTVGVYDLNGNPL